MALRKFITRLPLTKNLRSPFLSPSLFSRRCHSASSSIVEFLNPDEIGKLSLNLDDPRISNLLSRYRHHHRELLLKTDEFPDDYADFLGRIDSAREKIVEIDGQLDELRKNFPDGNRSTGDDDEALLADVTTDSELAKMIEDDRRELSEERRRIEKTLLSELAVWLLRSSESADREIPNDLIMEVSAGVGGQEAMLFTKEIFDMYRRYAQYRNWSFDILEEQTTDLNGLHFASAAISGEDAYARLRFEGGVHRVQRVPVTERTGRTHTSTMSVAILARPSSSSSGSDMAKINLKEFRFESFRSSAPGGQNVNKNDSASRVTHIPSGIAVACQMERQEHLNREWAIRRIMAILYERRMESQRNVTERSRKLQVGSLARSEKIRTYQYQQDRVTDHRTKENFQGIPETLAGGECLDRIVISMQRFHLDERLSEILDDEEKASAAANMKTEGSIRKTG